jgi:hypothetical protein
MRAKNRRRTAASQGVTKQNIVASTAPFNGAHGQAFDVMLEVLLSHLPLGHSTVIASRYASSAVSMLGSPSRSPTSDSEPSLPMRVKP